jgi:hypothetical protein
VGDALVGLALSTRLAAWFNTSFPSTVGFALVGLALRTLRAARFDTPLASSVGDALVGLALSTLRAAWFGASFPLPGKHVLCDISKLIISNFNF